MNLYNSPFLTFLCLACCIGCSPQTERTTPLLYSAHQAQAMHHSLNQIAFLPESKRSVDLVASVITGQEVAVVRIEVKREYPNSSVEELMELVSFTLTGQAINLLPSTVEDFQKKHRIFGFVEPEIYQLDETKQLLGYVYKTPNARVYVIVNLSFDTHQIPFPLGFMSSTKVSIWHSDTEEFATFVTQRPLSIQPLTLVIVKV
jgi:hypothetical protein